MRLGGVQTRRLLYSSSIAPEGPGGPPLSPAAGRLPCLEFGRGDPIAREVPLVQAQKLALGNLAKPFAIPRIDVLLCPPADVGGGLLLVHTPANDGAEESTAADRESSAASCAHRLGWAALLARVFSADISECAACGRRLRILVALTDPAWTYLEGLGLPAMPA